MKNDILIKRLLTDGSSRFIRLLAGNYTFEELPTELFQQPLRADLVLRSNSGVCHLEFQSTNDPRMNWRMLRYYDGMVTRFSFYQEDVRNAFRQIVLYIGRAEMMMPSQISDARLSFRYELIDIRTLAGWKDVLLDSPSPEDWIVACLCTMHPEDSVWRTVWGRIRTLPSNQRLDLTGKMALASALRPVPDDLKAEIERMSILLERGLSPFLDSVYVSGARSQAERTIREILADRNIDVSALDAALEASDLDELNEFIRRLYKGDAPEDLIRARLNASIV